MSLRLPLRGASQDSPSWLAPLFLLIGVVIPAASVLWFTNRAADMEAAAARSEVIAAYEGQLRLLRDRVDALWKARAEELAKARTFQAVVTGNLADSAIAFNADGSVAYPVPMPLPADSAPPVAWNAARNYEVGGRWKEAADLYGRYAQSTQDSNLAARAVQAQVRCLLQDGDREAALAVIDQFFVKGVGYRSVDTQRRRIAGDEFLLTIKILSANDRRRPLYVERLTRLLNDYENNRMPSAQRLFLASEAGLDLPTLEAERLAARFLEMDQPRVSGSGLRSTNLPDVWKLASADGRVLALFRTETIATIAREAVGEQPQGIQFTALPPGATTGDAGVGAGPMLPGWQLAFKITDSASIEAASTRRRNAFLWTGYLVIAGLVLIGLLLGHYLRRQMRLARLKTDMVAAVSHELKTPLASMRLLVDSLLGDERVDAVKTREYLTLIAGENERLTRVIENFLTFSRLERKKLRFQFRGTEPDAVVDSAVAAMRERFEQSGGKIAVAVEPGLPNLRADPDALSIVLINLLDNAYKYTPSDKRAEVRVFSENGHVVFAVADNGIGIRTSDRKRIFRQFYRVDQSLARETSGCGLGLSIVQSIVRAHGGEIRVASTFGQGSTFSVAIPAEARG